MLAVHYKARNKQNQELATNKVIDFDRISATTTKGLLYIFH